MTGIKPHRALSPATKKAVINRYIIESDYQRQVKRHIKELQGVHLKRQTYKLPTLGLPVDMRTKQHTEADY